MNTAVVELLAVAVGVPFVHDHFVMSSVNRWITFVPIATKLLICCGTPADDQNCSTSSVPSVPNHACHSCSGKILEAVTAKEPNNNPPFVHAKISMGLETRAAPRLSVARAVNVDFPNGTLLHTSE
jgi:hypothetical protein